MMIEFNTIWKLNNVEDARFMIVGISPGSVTVQPLSGGVPYEISKAQFLLCYQEVK